MTLHHTAEMNITTVRAGSVQRCSDVLVQQINRTFRVNGAVLTVSVCSPGDEIIHGTGFMLTGGLLAHGELPLSMEINGDEEVVAVLNHPLNPVPPPEPLISDLVIPIDSILEFMAVSTALAHIHNATGGTHSACLFLGASPVCQSEDISRSAAFEKVIGAAVTGRVPFDRTLLCLSSRVPADFVLKAARAGIPIIAAISAPTLQAAEEAERLGICLCGFVRGNQANVYSCPWRAGL